MFSLRRVRNYAAKLNTSMNCKNACSLSPTNARELRVVGFVVGYKPTPTMVISGMH
jgi:hypothetical protein